MAADHILNTRTHLYVYLLFQVIDQITDFKRQGTTSQSFNDVVLQAKFKPWCADSQPLGPNHNIPLQPVVLKNTDKVFFTYVLNHCLHIPELVFCVITSVSRHNLLIIILHIPMNSDILRLCNNCSFVKYLDWFSKWYPFIFPINSLSGAHVYMKRGAIFTSS